MGYRLLEHTADLGLEARGDSLQAALDQAVAALAAVLAGDHRVLGTEQQPVLIPASDLEAQVVALLDECLFRVEVHGWIASGATIERDAAGQLVGQLEGEPFDPSRHDGTAIKAITWHQLAVREDSSGCTITVYVDC